VRGADVAVLSRDLLSEKVITTMGLEHAPYYVRRRGRGVFVLGGLNLTTS